jgi:hypothetical protein
MGPATDTLAPIGLPLLLLGAAVTLIGGGVAWWLHRKRAAASTSARLRRAGEDLLAGILIPNADAGQIHIDFALLTKKEILVVDVRDVAGHVFGSDTMQEWTVLNSSRRSTFPNPLPLLYDRVAAVRRLLPETPVRGCVAFTPRALFTKGFPPNVAMLDSLLEEVSAERPPDDDAAKDALRQAWARLREAAG